LTIASATGSGIYYSVGASWRHLSFHQIHTPKKNHGFSKWFF